MVYQDCMEEIIVLVVVQGMYEFIEFELFFGVWVVWWNFIWCIGWLYWKSLYVFDVWWVMDVEMVFCFFCDYFCFVINEGNIWLVIIIFLFDVEGCMFLKILNYQFICYVGYV